MDFMVLAISSFGLGALHALEPGHGKTAVAAYLVGSRGSIRDALILGIVVTLTHTGGVLILAVLSLIATTVFDTEAIETTLQLVSGFLIILVGVWMLLTRARHKHSHGHTHDNHDHSHESNTKHPNDSSTQKQSYSLGQLIALGASGGIVPCHSALAILLASFSSPTPWWGIALLIIHSIGMASVIVIIGITVIKTADYAARFIAESKWTRVVPTISAVLVTLIGIVLTTRAILTIL